MAKPTNSTAARKKSSRSALLVVGFLVAIFALPTAILVLVGLVPTYGALLLDKEKGKLTTITVGALNIAALTPLLLELWGNHTETHAMQMLSSPFAWILMLAGAGIGWILAQVVPSVIVMVISARNKRRLETIRERQKRLVEEWGNSVTENIR